MRCLRGPVIEAECPASAAYRRSWSPSSRSDCRRLASSTRSAGPAGPWAQQVVETDPPVELPGKRTITDGVLAATAGRGADHVVETTGVVPILDELIDALAVGGCCAVVGAPRTGSRGSFDVPKLLSGRTIRGVTLGDSEPETFVPFLVEAYRRGVLPLDRIQRRYRFEDINQAARDATSGIAIKPVLVF